MKKRALGNSGLSVTPIGYGAWGIGGPPFWAEKDESEAIRAIQAAVDAGINIIDTAPVYGFGRSEEIAGKALEGRRDGVVIATKCGLRWKKEALGGIYNDLGPASIWEEVESSLRRLKTDHIDLYQIHWPDPKTPLEQTMVALSLLKAQGKIGHIGVSNFDEAMMAQALEIAPVVSLQPPYNMLQRDIEDKILPLCREKNVGVLAYSPLASGVLSGKYDEKSTFDGWRAKGNMGVFRKDTFGPAMKKVQLLKDFAAGKGVSLAELAIRWVIDQPGVTCALAGMNTAAHVEANIKALNVELGESEHAEIRKTLES